MEKRVAEFLGGIALIAFILILILGVTLGDFGGKSEDVIVTNNINVGTQGYSDRVYVQEPRVVERPVYQTRYQTRVIEKPIYIEKEKPVYVRQVVEKPVYIEKPVYVQQEKIVEKPVYIYPKQTTKNYYMYKDVVYRENYDLGIYADTNKVYIDNQGPGRYFNVEYVSKNEKGYGNVMNGRTYIPGGENNIFYYKAWSSFEESNNWHHRYY